jgi:uncharacterized alkaline shock family protein YloU
MAEQSTTPEQKAEPERTAPGRQVTRRGGGSQADLLRSERGTTSLADAVVTKVAAIAAREIGGVHDLGGGVARAIGGATGRVGMGTEATRGVSVEVGSRQAAVDLSLVLEYGVSIPEVTEAVRDNVIKRIEGITGLEVTEVNISVNDLYFPGDDTGGESRVE